MKSDNKIAWLASYPKSGNTWVRIFLEVLLYGSFDINNLCSSFHIRDLNLYARFLGVDPLELTAHERKSLQPRLYKTIFEQTQGVRLVKTHDCLQDFHRTLDPFKYVYLVRNPLDVCISLSEHMGCSYDEAIDYICSDFTLATKTDKYKVQDAQQVGNWSDHVISWTQNIENGLVLRYEDLILEPDETFKRLCELLNIDQSNLRQAIESCNFTQLQERERKDGFGEKSRHAQTFFTRGRSGAGIQLLSTNQIDKVILKHQKIMTAYGYDKF